MENDNNLMSHEKREIALDNFMLLVDAIGIEKAMIEVLGYFEDSEALENSRDILRLYNFEGGK